MNQTPLPPNASTDIHAGVTLAAAEQEARARLAEHIEEQNASASQQQKDLAAIVKQAHEQHAFLKGEQEKLAEKRSHDIDQLIREAQARQESAHEIRLREIKERRDEIHRLQQESEKKFSGMSPAEREQRGKELRNMMHQAVRQYQDLTAEQQRIIQEDHQRLTLLAQQIGEEKRRLQKEQTKRLENFLSGIIDSATSQRDQLKRHSKEVVEQEKSEMDSFIGNMHETYDGLLKGSTERTEEIRNHVIAQLELGKKLITEGKINEALQLRAELQHRAYNLQNEMRREQNRFASRNRMSLVEFEQEVHADAKTLQSRHEELIDRTRRQIDQDVKGEIDGMKHEFTGYIKSRLMEFEESILSRNRQLEVGQLQAIKKLKAMLEKQAEDTLRRQQEEQAGLFNYTLKLVNEIDLQSKANQQIIEQGQHLMMQTAKSSVSRMQEKGKTLEADICREQQEMIVHGFQETLNLVKQVREKQKQEREEITQKFMDERIGIGREASEAHKRIQEEYTLTNFQMQEARIKTGKDMQEELQKLQQERQELTKHELDKAMELGQQTHDRQNKITEDYQKALHEARQQYKKTMKELNERQKLLQEDQKKLEELIYQTRRRHRGLVDKEKEESQKELAALIECAKQKQQEMKEEQKEISRKAQEKMESAMHEAQQRRKEARQQLRQSYELALTEQEKETKIRDEMLRLAQQLLVKQQTGELGAVMAKIEAYLDKYRTQREQILSGVQQRLKDLENSYSTKQEE